VINHNNYQEVSMRFAKLFIIAVALALACISTDAQQTRTMTTYTTGTGSAVEADRGQAMDEATQTAQNWANSACIGTVTNTNTTSSNCTQLGSDDQNNVTYDCVVTVKATCVIQYNGR
jgi:hypothetical protein